MREDLDSVANNFQYQDGPYTQADALVAKTFQLGRLGDINPLPRHGPVFTTQSTNLYGLIHARQGYDSYIRQIVRRIGDRFRWNICIHNTHINVNLLVAAAVQDR